MRIVIIQESEHRTVQIKSPWLSINDAKDYLGISRAEFEKIKEQIPYKGFGRARRYHVDELDKYPGKDKSNG